MNDITKENPLHKIMVILNNNHDALTSLTQHIMQMESDMLRRIEEVKQETRDNAKNLFDKIDTEVVATSNKIAHLHQSKFEYVNLTDLGAMNSPSISNQRMGRLMRALGMIQTSKGRAIPYRDYLKNGMAITRQVNQYGNTTYDWHAIRTWEHIESKLDKHGKLNAFRAHTTAKDMEAFIDDLS